MNAKELREKRAALAAQIQKLADVAKNENRDFTADENDNWTKINADYEAMSRQIEIAERAERVAADQTARVGRDDVNTEGQRNDRAEQPATEEDRALALQAWFRVQSDLPLTERHEQACRRLRFRPEVRALDVNLAQTSSIRDATGHFRNKSSSRAMVEARANLSAVSGPEGAYTIPVDFVRSLELNMLAYGGMLQTSEIIRTDNGADLPWPTATDTSNTGTLLSESTTIGTSVSPTFSQIIWKAYKYSSKAILVPTELLEDSAFDLPGVIGGMLGERLGRISNTDFTTGTGAAKPKGIVTCATLGVTAASQTAITGDELLALVHSVDPAYRTGAAFMMHDNVLLHLRKLKDGNGQYIWQSGLAGGVPDTLLGYPVFINQDMASSVATTNKTILFGQLNKYKVRQVRGVRFYRMVERYRDYDQDGFVAFLRQDGNLLDAGTAPVKYLAQA